MLTSWDVLSLGGSGISVSFCGGIDAEEQGGSMCISTSVGCCMAAELAVPLHKSAGVVAICMAVRNTSKLQLLQTVFKLHVPSDLFESMNVLHYEVYRCLPQH